MRFRFPPALVAASVNANKLLGNKKGWPICASLYGKKLKGSRSAAIAVGIVDAMFWWDKRHCYKSWRMHTYNAPLFSRKSS